MTKIVIFFIDISVWEFGHDKLFYYEIWRLIVMNYELIWNCKIFLAFFQFIIRLMPRPKYLITPFCTFGWRMMQKHTHELMNKFNKQELFNKSSKNGTQSSHLEGMTIKNYNQYLSEGSRPGISTKRSWSHRICKNVSLQSCSTDWHTPENLSRYKDTYKRTKQFQSLQNCKM